MSDILTGRASTRSDEEAPTEEANNVQPEGSREGSREGPREKSLDSSLLCLVCTKRMGPPNSVLIQPCRCGYWVHDQCLIDVTMNFEDLHPDTRAIGCKICRRAYNIAPAKELLLKIALKLDVWYQNFCYAMFESGLVLVADMAFVKLGAHVVKMVYGPEDAVHLFDTMAPLRAVLICQSIPVACIILSNVPWEYSLLRILRKFSRLPLVGWVFPMENQEIPDIYYRKSSFSLNVVGGLLLPLYAAQASKLFTGLVEDPLLRLLLGGATVMLCKGLCQMYYKQRKYSRYCTLRVKDS